jgi:hypothetical protein
MAMCYCAGVLVATGGGAGRAVLGHPSRGHPSFAVSCRGRQMAGAGGWQGRARKEQVFVAGWWWRGHSRQEAHSRQGAPATSITREAVVEEGDLLPLHAVMYRGPVARWRGHMMCTPWPGGIAFAYMDHSRAHEPTNHGQGGTSSPPSALEPGTLKTEAGYCCSSKAV